MSITKPNQEIFEKIRDMVADRLAVDKELVTLQANFVDDLGADSLDTVELVMAIEEQFGIEIEDEAAEKISTLAHAIDYIEKAVKK